MTPTVEQKVTHELDAIFLEEEQTGGIEELDFESYIFDPSLLLEVDDES